MKTPDKIYIQPNARDSWFEGEKPSDIFEEYIRKDALMEWTVYMRDKNQFGDYEYSLFQTIIDKLNSM